MSATKLLNQWGLLGSVEASYGVSPVLSPATHGVLTLEPPRVNIEFAHDGARNGRAPGTGGQMRRVSKSGRSGTLEVSTEFMGSGVAYSAAVVPSIHTLLRASGHAAALTATAGTERYVYTPQATGFVSGAFKAFLGGQSQALRGVYGSMSISAEGPVVPSFNFELQGLADAVTDEAIPAITYPNAAINPPKSENIALTLNGWAGGVVRSWGLTQNFERGARLDDNSAGHAGFSPGRHDPQMEITVEACPLATFNPYTLADSATAFAVALGVGSVKYNKFSIAAPTAQITNISEEEDGPTALWTLTLQLSASGFGTTDMYTITAD